VIVTRIVGGLGNQMFQYAAGLSLAKRLDVPLYLDIRSFANYSLHPYSLDAFDLQGKIASEEILSLFSDRFLRARKLAHRIGLLGSWYFAPDMLYDPNWLKVRDQTLIFGNFQSEKFFSNVSYEIRQEFSLGNFCSGKALDLIQSIKNSNSVMLHIRRGDYVSDKRTLSIHGVCDLNYYRRAIAHLQARLDNLKLFVFSNDFDWVYENLQIDLPCTYISDFQREPIIDLALMSHCKHHIIANSTFSWWGAWLANSSNGLVIAPKQWFATNRYDTSDLFPSSWIQL
jgi:hypothetical protein